MPVSCEVCHKKEENRRVFFAWFELEIRGRKSVFVIGKFYNKTEQKPIHLNKPPVIWNRKSTDNRSTVDRLFADTVTNVLADMFGSDLFPYPDNTVNYQFTGILGRHELLSTRANWEKKSNFKINSGYKCKVILKIFEFLFSSCRTCLDQKKNCLCFCCVWTKLVDVVKR